MNNMEAQFSRADSTAVSESNHTRRFTFPPLLKTYLFALFSLSAATWSMVLSYSFRGRNPNAALVWSVWNDRFTDFWHYHALFPLLHTKEFFTGSERFAYPAPCAVIYNFFYKLPYPHVAFVSILWTTDVATAFAFAYMLIRGGISKSRAAVYAAIIFYLSYPWYRLYDRSNLELFVYIFIATGLWALISGRPRLAAILWGTAGALKIYPVILLAHFLRRGLWKSFVTGCVAMAAVLIASFKFVGPTVADAARGSISGIVGFTGKYAVTARRAELHIDHSILGSIKEVVSLHILHGFGKSWDGLSHGYQICAAVIAPLLFFILSRHLPALNRIGILICYITILPPVSYDYTLIHLYLVIGIVMWAALSAHANGKIFPHATLFAICFAIISTAQTWLLLRFLNLNGILKCGAVLTIIWLLYRVRLPYLPGEHQDATT